jgi:hypothetical protein
MTMTVTATQSGSTQNDILLAVIVLTGAATSPVGAVSNSLTAIAKAITPTATGSYIYGAVSDNQTSIAVASSATTLKGSLTDSATVWGGGAFRSTAKTTAATAVTLGINGTPAEPGWVAVEFLASGTLAEDASTPAAVSAKALTVTTAAFTPPAGSVVAALVASDVGFTGSTTISLSNTGGLTFTQAETAGGTGSNYLASVFWAQVAVPPSYTGASRIGGSGAFISLAGPRSSAGASKITAAATLAGYPPPPVVSKVQASTALTATGHKTASGASRIAAGGGMVPLNYLAPASQAPAWLAARAGMPGATAAVNHAAQISQFLGTHGVSAVYEGAQIVAPAGSSAAPVQWAALTGTDVDQPFAMPTGKTTIGRVTLPLSPTGNGADVTVSLCADSAGSPGAVLATTRIPAQWLTALAAPDGLDDGGPLATAASNTMVFGGATTTAWTQPAVSVNGSGNYAAPVTSGGFAILLGGYDNTAGGVITTVATIAYLGGGTISGPMPQPSLPQAAFLSVATATPDTVLFAGGTNTSPGDAGLATVSTASWDPATGTVGSWTAQASLPNAVVSGAMVSWQDNVYVIGGNTNDETATATANVWWSPVTNGQITAWSAGPALPQALANMHAAVVNGWLIVAGGVNAAGTPQTAVLYAAISADGALGSWQAGPVLPQAAYNYTSGWSLAVTDNAMIIVSGWDAPSTHSPSTMILTVTADGPAPAWQKQPCYSQGNYQVVCFQDGVSGEWQVINLHLTSYDTTPVVPVPLISVPLPATGLTAGATYHVVVHQDGGDLNDYVQVALLTSALPIAAQTRPGGGAWTPGTGSLIASVWDQTATGSLQHLWEDTGAKVTSLVYAGGSDALLGVCEATVFPDGTVLPAVTAIAYTGTRPAGTVQLA